MVGTKGPRNDVLSSSENCVWSDVAGVQGMWGQEWLGSTVSGLKDSWCPGWLGSRVTLVQSIRGPGWLESGVSGGGT